WEIDVNSIAPKQRGAYISLSNEQISRELELLAQQAQFEQDAYKRADTLNEQVNGVYKCHIGPV
ncbi:MAG TPA: hypothetical protein VHA52_06760, partial [Candidatus Babeliaceae bacterium]|nr:hypothetical protein [Candidatus Babeliaceae bacterium]